VNFWELLWQNFLQAGWPCCHPTNSAKALKDDSVRTKLHYTDTGYEHRLQTPPTDKLTTILQQICHIVMPEPNISTCQDVGMWQIFVRWWCSLVVFVAGVHSRCPCSGVWLLLTTDSMLSCQEYCDSCADYFALQLQWSIPPVTITVFLTWDSILSPCCHDEPRTLSWQTDRMSLLVSQPTESKQCRPAAEKHERNNN